MRDALVLNASYEPLCVVSARRAAVLVLVGKAVPVVESGAALHSERRVLAVPSVVRLAHLVRVPYRATAPLTRRAVFARDCHRCAYCDRSATTIDHVVPRSRGGHHAWDNVVAACGACNHRKADRTLAELGWVLRTAPRAPHGPGWWVHTARSVDPVWQDWLPAPRAQAPGRPASVRGHGHPAA